MDNIGYLFETIREFRRRGLEVRMNCLLFISIFISIRISSYSSDMKSVEPIVSIVSTGLRTDLNHDICY